MTEIFAILGFILAACSVVGNDSIQTLGTFLASNRDVKWYYLWGFISSILVIAFVYSWVQHNGDISFERLNKIEYTEVQWYHVLAPATLLLLTRFKIPVSTSLLILSTFASALVFEKILLKSALGYGIAAVTAYLLWIVIRNWDKPSESKSSPQTRMRWRIFQWYATGFLWFTWLSHDIANIAVFLPRSLSVEMLIFVLLVFLTGLAYSFYKRGGPIQDLVLEKTNTMYIRSACFIDVFYTLILLVFKEWSDIPMSTTWVFIGLLTGRELAMHTFTGVFSKKKHREEKRDAAKTVFPLVVKDFLRLLLGLGVSIVIAVLIQKVF